MFIFLLVLGGVGVDGSEQEDGVANLVGHRVGDARGFGCSESGKAPVGPARSPGCRG